ncbi:MAG: SPASM domain-containing protein [Bdellovibrionota bacterium]
MMSISINSKNDKTSDTSKVSATTGSPKWKAFIFPHGSYLIHLPTAHVILTREDIAQKVLNNETDIPELIAFEAKLPKTVAKELPKIDISAIALNVEESCNLRCTYCYAGDGNYGKDSSMTLAVAKDILTSLAKGKPRFHIQFFGGEPLLNFKLIEEIVHWCKTWSETKFTFSITTNGVLLRDQIMDFLKENKFSVTISYDGKAIQEAQRKFKNLNTSSNFIRNKIIKYEKDFSQLPSFTIRGTVSNNEVSKSEAAMFDSLNSFKHSVAISRASIDKFGNAYNEKDIDTLIQALTSVVEHYLNLEDFDTIMRIAKIRSFIKILHFGRLHLNTCTAGLNYLSVSTSGQYFLCHRFTEDESAKVGNYKNGIDTDKLSQLRNHRMGEQEPCRSCWMRNWCGGGCYHENQLATGSKTKIDRNFCRIQNAEISLAMKCYTRILQKRPELLEA